eukprot:TRINITY_DN69621_c0_g1_i1.p1 TRINITY_DN69621_c0_g1~~TRINITY_DN69621_c0_g1_i1.p1  ORF type:complete len:499 (-),score=69.07 TRINITY_DN69621_c0_g1_i1:103-1599(-)
MLRTCGRTWCSVASRLTDTALFRPACYINGTWVESPDTIEVYNPATGNTIASVPDLSTNQIKDAISCASAALAPWQALTAAERCARVARWGELLLENKKDLAAIITMEEGKPLAEAEGEVAYGASFCSWFAEEGKRMYGQTVPPVKPNTRILVQKQPVGVCGIITPWNFPNALITRKAAAGLVAGCTVVCKPSELTPLSATALAELAERAGIPPGCFNVITGTPAKVGKELTENFSVRKISFTGSTGTGKLLLSQCAADVKRVSLELGGNAPVIVFDDADIDKAVTTSIAAKMRNAGQVCVAPNRFFVHEKVADQFTEKMVNVLSKFQIGDGMCDGVNMGPLINQAAIEKIERLVKDAVGKGSELVFSSTQEQAKLACGGGTYQSIQVLRNVAPNALLQKEELFGPVAPIIPFTEEEDVIARANDTEYGLAAYFFTRDVGRIFRVSEGLQYGMIGANDPLISTTAAPFGGMKHSGLGREGGSFGIEEYLDVKYTLVGL